MRPNYFIFMGYFRKKWDKTSKANPPHTFIHIYPLSRNPGSARSIRHDLVIQIAGYIQSLQCYILSWFTTNVYWRSCTLNNNDEVFCTMIVGSFQDLQIILIKLWVRPLSHRRRKLFNIVGGGQSQQGQLQYLGVGVVKWTYTHACAYTCMC